MLLRLSLTAGAAVNGARVGVNFMELAEQFRQTVTTWKEA